MVNAIKPTLGPLPRVVASTRTVGDRPPELLDDGGTIARRIIQIPNRDEDMGAMFTRQVLWTLREKTGDGTATAAVLLQKIYSLGIKYIVAGGNAMLLRPYLEEGMKVITQELDRQVRYLEDREQLVGLAETICHDPPLAKMLGEIMDIVGAYGELDIRQGSALELSRDYVEGMYWEGGLLSRSMADDEIRYRSDTTNASILISDLEIKSPQELLPLMEMAVQAKIDTLWLVVKSISDPAISITLNKANRKKIRVYAVKTPGLTIENQMFALEDMAILTGGKPVYARTGMTTESVRPEHLGKARRVWGDRYYFGIVGGRGDVRQLRQHIRELKESFYRKQKPDERKPIQQRLGKLMGGSAILTVGGLTKDVIEVRKEMAERTAESMRGAIRDGVLPGGGVALLACCKALQARLHDSMEFEERAAYHILLQALETPFRVLMENAGLNPSRYLVQMEKMGESSGVNALTGEVVDMFEAGIIDSATVVKTAVQTAIASAALALTTDILIHRRKPEESYAAP